jgi:hypothetical protein
MARASIPYDRLQIAAEKLFPEPTYRNIRLEGSMRRRQSYEEKPTPTTIYDRRTGNYKSIGYRCYLSGQRIAGIDDNFNPVFDFFRGWYLVELD